MNVGVHAQLCPGDKALAAHVAGVLAAHVMTLDMVLQRVLRFEHPTAAGAEEGCLAVLVVHVSHCKEKTNKWYSTQHRRDLYKL